jgi:hypothetical protein
LTRKEAKKQNQPTYTGGRVCRFNHENKRFTSTGSCVQCSYTHRQSYEVTHKDRQRVYRQKYSRENKEMLNKRTRDWHRNNPRRSYWLAAKDRASTQGVPFSLTEEDIVFPDTCPVLGTPIILLKTDGPRKRNDNTPSLDRIIPALGYTKENVRVISWRANRLKNDAHLHEIEKIAKYMRETREPFYKEGWS